jgi:hypothetical protein
VRQHCRERGWPVTVVHEMQREDVTAAPEVKPGIVQHEQSFEVVRGDGGVEFFYFDENAGRRAINNRLSKEAALAAAQAHLSE